MIDRSGRTYEEYRQLYWDEKARRKAAEVKVDNFESDAYVLSLLTKIDEYQEVIDGISLECATAQKQLVTTRNIINTDEGVAAVYSRNIELEAQLVAVRLLPDKWRKSGAFDYAGYQDCAKQLEAAIGEVKS